MSQGVRIGLAGKFIALGLTRNRVLDITGLTRHQYYYKSSKGKRGRKASSRTKKMEKKQMVEHTNEEVVDWIKTRQSDPDLESGHRRMTAALMLVGYFINHKKVFRLMKENQLLLDKPKRQSKKYAKYRTLTPEGPLEVFEMDIKIAYCSEHRKHAQILTIIDVFTRTAIYWEVGHAMKQGQILKAWKMIIEHILQPAGKYGSDIHIEVRNDNGPQFSAKTLRGFFEENGLDHVFTHPYTPQENGHVESFHAILGKTLDRYEFWSLGDLEDRLEVFYQNYNNKRIHSSIANLPPGIFWRLWNEGKLKRKVCSKRKVRFTLLSGYQQLSGNGSLRELPCFSFSDLDGREMKPECPLTSPEKVDGPNWPITLKNNHRYKDHHRSFPAENKSMAKNSIFV